MKEYIVPIPNPIGVLRIIIYDRIPKRYEELIRCEDCKYHYYHEMLKQHYCEIPNMQFGEIEPNGYCHRAERKEE